MKPLNWNSTELTQGWQRGSQAFYWGLGFQEDDFQKAQVGIGTPLLEGNLCNVHAYRLAGLLRDSCIEAGLVAFPFGVSSVSDNLVQGQPGGSASLISRSMIANGCEMVCSAHRYDAVIGLHHCDKNGPGFALALARLNYPGLIVSGGSILPGCHNGKPTSILDVYAAQAEYNAGKMSREESEEIIRTGCPGPGGCGIAASFNTWGIALEAMGLSLINTSSSLATDESKLADCRRVGIAIRKLLEMNLRPLDILSKRSLYNAMVTIAAIGGSTNGVLHLLALAREAKVEFGLSDVQRICRSTPVCCNFAPRGSGTMFDLHQAGGTGRLLKMLLKSNLLDGQCMTVSGMTLEESLELLNPIEEDGRLIATPAKPFKPYADIQVCFGNLAPDGIVFKVTSESQRVFRGQAICFQTARDVADAAVQGRIKPGHIVVLRGLGPVACAMPEIHIAAAALSAPELKNQVALLSDTRVSGVSSGAIGVHCAPEAAVGGPIGNVQDGDWLSFDLLQGIIHWESERAVSKIVWKRDPSEPTYVREFAAMTTQANHGCVSHCALDRSVLQTGAPEQTEASNLAAIRVALD